MSVPELKRRDRDSHKGTHGRALLVGGSRGMAGAVSLSGYGAIKSGAGLVTLAVPDRCLETVAAFNPCFMTVPLADYGDGGAVSADASAVVLNLAENATSIGIGPGMSRRGGVIAVVSDLYRQYAGPMVVDADALNALATQPDILNQAPGPRILTPHVGEFRRLVGDPDLSPAACRDRASQFAAKNKVIVVLKGHKTLVTDGTATYENTTGNPGMATGGAGDVLTGVITALLGQGYTPQEAAVLGVYVHGIAGDIARDAWGEISMSAVDIAESLPEAFQVTGGS